MTQSKMAWQKNYLACKKSITNNVGCKCILLHPVNDGDHCLLPEAHLGSGNQLFTAYFVCVTTPPPVTNFDPHDINQCALQTLKDRMICRWMGYEINDTSSLSS